MIWYRDQGKAQLLISHINSLLQQTKDDNYVLALLWIRSRLEKRLK